MMQLYAKAAIALALGVGLPTWVLQDQGGNNQAPTQDSSASQDKQAEKPDQSSPEEKKPAENATQQTGEATSDKAGTQPKSGIQPLPNSKSRPRANRWAQTSDGNPRKRIIRRGGVSEPTTQIIPGMTLDQSNRLRQEAQDLLTAADSDLKKLASRSLNVNQQETVSQIHHYMDIARSALVDGDIERAHTLAQKAQLLSDDLVKH